MTEILMLVVVGFLAIGGALAVLVSAVGMLRTKDAVTRVNVLSPATGLGLPMLVLAAIVHYTYEFGLDWMELLKALLAVVGFIIVSSLASNTLGRAAYRSGAPVDPATEPNDLATEPPGTH
ncbi:hypothetical protein BH24ACT8_BH24ACT8_21650 [soil metagenome]|jgi:multicomponent Na+:H+ antiporter subunit G